MKYKNQPKKPRTLRDDLRELGLDPTDRNYLDKPFIKIVIIFFVAFIVSPFLYIEFTDPSTPKWDKNLYTGILVFYFILSIGYVINDYYYKKEKKEEADRELKALKKRLEEYVVKGIISKEKKERADIKLKYLKDLIDAGNIKEFDSQKLAMEREGAF
jgi:hypothetical protein